MAPNLLWLVMVRGLNTVISDWTLDMYDCTYSMNILCFQSDRFSVGELKQKIADELK